MQTYHVAVIVSKDGTLTLKKLPFRAGDKVEVVVRSRERALGRGKRYPLRGTPVRYVDPFGSVAEGDWNVLQ
jgi:hypothetical protein